MKTLTTKEASQMLCLTETSIKVKAKSGEIPGAKIGNKWVFLEVDLIAFIRSQYKSAQGDKEITCRSTNVKIHNTGGLKSRPQAVNEYSKALGLTIN